jgi:hypothetical protein
MYISLFAEFPHIKDPNINDLVALKYIDFPISKLYYAATSIKECYEETSKINNPYIIKYVPWLLTERIPEHILKAPPTERKALLRKEIEGLYWPGPTANRNALLKIERDIKTNGRAGLEVLLDLEPPLLTHWIISEHSFRISRGRFHLFKNHETLEKMVRNPYVTTVVESMKVPNWFQELFGFAFNPNRKRYHPLKKMKMIYKYTKNFIKEKRIKDIINKCKWGIKRYGKSFRVALGCIGKGVFMNEPELTNEELDYHLYYLKKLGIEEVAIFRLGGLNKERAAIIRQYAT